MVTYNQSQLKDLVEESSQNQNTFRAFIQKSINQFNARIPGLNPELDIEELEELAREIEFLPLLILKDRICEATNCNKPFLNLKHQ
ncbi:MAG: hypothetical protein Ct9H90mP13_03140 [Pseudomonadota bacterium]|nr:MAG: hypothetical protein Ct9H90mP13_03140 [Pseudomonadota bacterium]